MAVLIHYISAIDQAINPREKFLPFSLSEVVECDLKDKEDHEKGEEESPSKESEDEEKRPDGDADRQGQAPGPGNISFSGMGGRDGPYNSSITGEDEDENPVFLGLKVYTKNLKEAVVVVMGRVWGGSENEDGDEQGDDGDENEDE